MNGRDAQCDKAEVRKILKIMTLVATLGQRFALMSAFDVDQSSWGTSVWSRNFLALERNVERRAQPL